MKTNNIPLGEKTMGKLLILLLDLSSRQFIYLSTTPPQKQHWVCDDWTEMAIST
jgi:hypothetical protein